MKKILQSGGPASTGTRAEYVKWFDDKVWNGCTRCTPLFMIVAMSQLCIEAPNRLCSCWARRTQGHGQI